MNNNFLKSLFRILLPILVIGFIVVLNILNYQSWKVSDYLTLTIIILTYFYVVFTYDMLVRLKSESYLERRPYLTCDFESHKKQMTFYLKNVGKTPAKNVLIRFNPEVKMVGSLSLNNSIFQDPINHFPPNKVVETFLNESSQFFKDNPEKIKVELNYEDYFSNKYREEITLDLNHHKNQMFLVEKSMNDLVKSIAELNKTIAKNN